jgi:hypothetical protein
MQILCTLVWLSGAYPLWRAWQANRQTSLVHAVSWAVASWTVWGVVICLSGDWTRAAASGSCYAALALTGCASMAVLGARRPLAGPWNFVVLSLLAVDLLPLAEGIVTGGSLQLSTLRIVCLAATIGVGILNYIPTTLAPAALLLLLSSFVEFAAVTYADLWDHEFRRFLRIGWFGLSFVPWAAYWSIHSKRPPAAEFDVLWLSFRNRFGFVWGQRLREQFNHSASHAGWPVILRWQGLRLLPGTVLPAPVVQAEIVSTLRALMKRFEPETEPERVAGKECNP